MTIIMKDVDPVDFLENYSWCCLYLKACLDEKNLWDKFRSYIEEMFDTVSETELHDFFRFETDTILQEIGYYDDEDKKEE